MFHKKILILGILILCSILGYSQINGVYEIKNADTVKLYSSKPSVPYTELILRNRTKDTLGFLYNKGNGLTEFRRALKKINDSVYLIGVDTLKLKATVGIPNPIESAGSIDGNGTTGNELKLKNDVTNPAPKYYYGTDASGSKGYFALPTGIDSVFAQYSIVGNGKTSNNLRLANDVANPGATKYYGTDASGTKGYFSVPPSTGEVNIATNAGTGLSLILPKSGVNLPFKSLIFTGGSVVGTNNTNDITIALSGDLNTPGANRFYGTNGSGVKGWYESLPGVTQLSITGSGTSGDGYKLVNDAATPGNTKYYGTDASGVKGYFTLPANSRTSSSVGSGVEVFKQLNVDNFEFRTLTTPDNTVKATQQSNVVELRVDSTLMSTKLYAKHLADSVGNITSEGIVNLDSSRTSSTVTVVSATGTSALLQAASHDLAGVLTSFDKVRIDSVFSPSGNKKYWGTNSTGVRGFYSLPGTLTTNSITLSGDSVKLVNDATTPGNTKYYGTDGSGTKGYFALPASGEINTVSNAGAGVGLAKSKVGYDIPVKSLTSNSTVILGNNTNDVSISVDTTVMATKNYVDIHSGGGSPNTFYEQNFSSTLNQTNFIISGTLPTDLSKITVVRNGVVLNSFSKSGTDTIIILSCDFGDLIKIKWIN